MDKKLRVFATIYVTEDGVETRVTNDKPFESVEEAIEFLTKFSKETL